MRVFRTPIAHLFAAVVFVAPPVLAQKPFTIPLADLEKWSSAVVTQVEAQIDGHSKVHPVANDCEMHFGATITGFHGEPAGFVLEPMNLCIEPFPGKSSPVNRDWERYGDSLVGTTVQAEGIIRIWPE